MLGINIDIVNLKYKIFIVVNSVKKNVKNKFGWIIFLNVSWFWVVLVLIIW